jgi:hypothetical protein
MAVGPPTCKVEIEWSIGTWTDVTAYAADAMGGTFGRATEFDDISAGTWNLTLRNDDGRFTPDNPLSPYFPNVVENRRLRVTLTPPGGSPYVRFLGYITSLEPSFPDQGGYSGVVAVQAADLLAVINRQQMQTGYVEQANLNARWHSSWNDTFTFDNVNPGATTFQNLGETGTRSSIGTAVIVAASSGAGVFESGTADTLMIDGALTLTPTGIVGPVLKVVPGGIPAQIEFFVKIPPTGLAVGTPALTIFDAYDKNSLNLFSLRMAAVNHGSSTTVDFAIYNGGGTIDNYLNGLAGGAAVDTNTWVKVTMFESGGNLCFNFNDGGLVLGFGYDVAQVASMYFGGFMASNNKATQAQAGKQTLCPTMSVCGIDVQGGGGGAWGYYAFGTPPPCLAVERWKELAGYGSKVTPWRITNDFTITAGSAVVSSASANFSADDVGRGFYATNSGFQIGSYFPANTVVSSVQSPTQATMSAPAVAGTFVAGATTPYATTYNTNSAPLTNVGTYGVVGPAVIGNDNRTVVRYNPDGQTLADAMQLHARTVGGTVWTSNAGVLTLILPDAMRPNVPIATVSIEDDCVAADFQLRRSVDQAPTRVTVTSPIGQAIVTDPVAEALGYRREVTVDCACATTADLASIGNFYLKATKKLRITQLTVDLASGATNLYATFYGSLRPGSRVRITGLPSTTFGFTYVDVYVQGWTESYNASGATITFDCSPCDAPTEGTFDDAEFGRFAADGTLDLAAAITATDTTLAITPGAGATATTPVMTTASADYPLDVDLNGERVTLPAPPSSTTTRTNRCTNPSFGTNTTGWAGGGTVPTLATSTAYAYAGTSSMRVTWPTAAAGASTVGYSTAVTIGATYAFSVYVYVPSGSPDVQLVLLTGSASLSYSGGQQSSAGTNNAWVRLGYIIGHDQLHHRHRRRHPDRRREHQPDSSPTPTPPSSSRGSERIGTPTSTATNGGLWTGTAHASTSTQVIQTYTGVTRGVVPTVSRAHLAGEDVDLWHGAALAL